MRFMRAGNACTLRNNINMRAAIYQKQSLSPRSSSVKGGGIWWYGGGSSSSEDVHAEMCHPHVLDLRHEFNRFFRNLEPP